MPTRLAAAEGLGETEAGGPEAEGDGPVGTVGATEPEAGVTNGVEAVGAVGAAEHAIKRVVPKTQAIKLVIAPVVRLIAGR